MKVQVLLSTYNSTEYLVEQLQSLLNQRDVNVSILVRDDGSSNTESEAIINRLKFENKNACIEFYKEMNKGPAKSFLDLIKHSSDSCDYYAFCDQDDIWDENKLKEAIGQLTKLPKFQPNCCFCNYRTCNSSGKVIGISNIPNNYISNYKNVLLSNPAPGCCMVINKVTRDLIIQRDIPNDIIMHDSWIMLICSMLGEVIFDPEAHISYRQHSNNAIGIATSLSKKIKFKIKYLADKRHSGSHAAQARAFFSLYGNFVTDSKKRKVLRMLCEYDRSFKYRIMLFFSPNVYSYNWKITIYFKLAVLINRW